MIPPALHPTFQLINKRYYYYYFNMLATTIRCTSVHSRNDSSWHKTNDNDIQTEK